MVLVSEKGEIYEEVILFAEALFTPAAITTVEPLYAEAHHFVSSFIIRVRDMGTATYVRLGTAQIQPHSLDTVGQTLEWDGDKREVTDMAKLYAISDTADAVLEIVTEYAPVRHAMQVTPVEGRGVY